MPVFTSTLPRPKNRLPYGRVFFAARDRLGLSNDAYLLADMVHLLARRSGWCYASSDYLAATLGVSTRQLRRHLARLVSAGLVERQGGARRQLRTTKAWAAATASASTGQRKPVSPDKTSDR